MTSRASIDELVLGLRGQATRLAILDDLAAHPVVDVRVDRELAAMLDDETPCVLPGPFAAELRLAAAIALASVRAPAPVRVRARDPMPGSSLFDGLERAGLPMPAVVGSPALVSAFAALRDLGLLPERELELVAPVDLAALSPPACPDVEEAPIGRSGARDLRRPTEDDVRFYLSALADEAPSTRAIAAQNLASAPTGDARIAARLSELLGDEAACLVAIPIRIGEVRYLSARALRAERRARGDDEPVRVRCTEPVTADDLARASARAGIEPPTRETALDAQLALFDQLRAGGYLPTVELAL